MGRHTGYMDFSAAQMEEQQNVIRDQPAQGPDLGREEVGRHQHVHMRADKLLPRGGRLALWSWRDAMTFKNVAQFVAVCSSYILAETLGYAVSFSSPWRGKRRVFERRKPVLIDQLQPSTNSDKLSDSIKLTMPPVACPCRQL